MPILAPVEEIPELSWSKPYDPNRMLIIFGNHSVRQVDTSSRLMSWIMACLSSHGPLLAETISIRKPDTYLSS